MSEKQLNDKFAELCQQYVHLLFAKEQLDAKVASIKSQIDSMYLIKPLIKKDKQNESE